MKPRMLICGNYGVPNVGDEAILRALMQKFSQDYEITVMSANHAETSAKFNIQAVPFLPTGFRTILKAYLSKKGRKNFAITKNAVNKCDVFLFGGGTLLTDKPIRSIWIWGKHLEYAYSLRKKVWIYANGIGPFKTKSAQKWAKKLVMLADKISVRDRKSYNCVKEWGRVDVTQIRDPVFEWDCPKKQAAISTKDAIIFTPRHWTKNMNNLINSFAGLIQYICLKKGKKVIGIPFEKNNKKDIDLLNKIFELAGVGEQAEIWKDYNDEIDVISAINNSGGVIGMRLHSLIFAAKANVPFLGISYMDKVGALGEELGKKDSVLPMEGIKPEKMIEVFRQIFSHIF